MTRIVGGVEFVACPFCKQYSHSIGDDQLAEAFLHFQTIIAHPVRGHPMCDAFDAKTKDAAQVLMAAARAASGDTFPKGQDAKQGLAGTEGSAVGKAETPTPSHHQESSHD